MQQIHESETLEGAALLHVELVKDKFQYELMWVKKRKTIEAMKKNERLKGATRDLAHRLAKGGGANKKTDC
jgi:hypothetical protein